MFDGFTYSDALRVSIWSKQGLDIPGLSKADQKELERTSAAKEKARIKDEDEVIKAMGN